DVSPPLVRERLDPRVGKCGRPTRRLRAAGIARRNQTRHDQKPGETQVLHNTLQRLKNSLFTMGSSAGFPPEDRESKSAQDLAGGDQRERGRRRLGARSFAKIFLSSTLARSRFVRRAGESPRPPRLMNQLSIDMADWNLLPFVRRLESTA